jgi:hypothetical protein
MFAIISISVFFFGLPQGSEKAIPSTSTAQMKILEKIPEAREVRLQQMKRRYSLPLADATNKKVQKTASTPSPDLLHKSPSIVTQSTDILSDSEASTRNSGPGFWEQNSISLVSFNMLMDGLADVRIPRTMMLPDNLIPQPLQRVVESNDEQKKLFYVLADKLKALYSPWHRATFPCGFTGPNSKRKPSSECASNWFGSNCDEILLRKHWAIQDLRSSIKAACEAGAETEGELELLRANGAYTNDNLISPDNKLVMAKVTKRDKSVVESQLKPLSVSMEQVISQLGLPNPETLAGQVLTQLEQYNAQVMNWSPRKDKITSYLMEKSADMIGVVEFDRDDLAFHGYSRIENLDGKLGFFWKASSGWVCEKAASAKFHWEDSGKSYMIVKCQKGGQTMLLAIAHLVSDPQDKTGKQRASHLRELNAKMTFLKRFIKGPVNVALLGDMNIDLHEQKQIWKNAKELNFGVSDGKFSIEFAGGVLALGNAVPGDANVMTSVTPQRREMLDYIWSDIPMQNTTEALPMEIRFIPDTTIPSDHIAVSVRMGTESDDN